MGGETFEIVVKGTLSPALASAFDGFEVRGIGDGKTRLVGQVPDQARLHGLLELFRDLTIELISVNRVRDAMPLPPPDGPNEGTPIG